jgi:transcriptional regulator with XRE-family HTH domain
MDDEAWLNSVVGDAAERWSYHEICKWLPYKPETIDDIANDMVANGYRHDRPVVVYEGLILDGRHRYEAALKAGIDPIFVEFQGTKEEAIAYVTSENVARRHLSNPEKEFFYAQRAEALGVRERKDNQHTPNGASSPSQEDHADALGVGHRTVNRWENTRKEIKADPVLSQKATTPEGYQEAKREVQKRRKATQGEEKRIRNMKDRAASTDSEAERIAVQKKLDKYRDEGVDVDAVMDQKEEDQEREGYFREKQNREGIALRLATKLIEQGNTRVIKSLVLSAFPSEAQLLQAERDYT